MHFVAALDQVPGMRCVLGLFEGVVTGAADGYYRLARKPASTLLHLGPGLANGLANLHNAKKASSGVVNIVGDHATYHLGLDAPLTSDIEGVARPMSHWVKTSPNSKTIAGDGALAIAAARQAPGQIATLILPADTAWGPADGIAETPAPAMVPKASAEAVKASAAMLKSSKTATLLLGGGALNAPCLELAGRIAAKTGCGIITEGFNARLDRGAGRVQVARVPYVVEAALHVLAKAGDLVLVGSRVPVAFFAYPDKPSILVPEGTKSTKLVGVDEDVEGALLALAEELDAVHTPPARIAAPRRPELPLDGPITSAAIAAILGAHIPENGIIVDESVTTGREFFAETAGAPPHMWLNNRGGSIGYGLPVAIGAAIAAPDSKVIALEGDGSAMYTIQSLWTLARENLHVTVMVFNNGSYNILRTELTNVGVKNPGPRAVDMLSLRRPDLDWVAMAKGMGVPGVRVKTVAELTKAVNNGLRSGGPNLIEVML
jgi:acetolactate synthase-1/2/3 large subunit